MSILNTCEPTASYTKTSGARGSPLTLAPCEGMNTSPPVDTKGKTRCGGAGPLPASNNGAKSPRETRASALCPPEATATPSKVTASERKLPFGAAAGMGTERVSLQLPSASGNEEIHTGNVVVATCWSAAQGVAADDEDVSNGAGVRVATAVTATPSMRATAAGLEAARATASAEQIAVKSAVVPGRIVGAKEGSMRHTSSAGTASASHSLARRRCEASPDLSSPLECGSLAREISTEDALTETVDAA